MVSGKFGGLTDYRFVKCHRPIQGFDDGVDALDEDSAKQVAFFGDTERSA